MSHYFTCFTITYTLTDKTEARAYGFLNYPKFCPFTYVEDCMWKWSHHSEINIDSCTENVAEVQKDSEHSRLLQTVGPLLRRFLFLFQYTRSGNAVNITLKGYDI